MSHPESPVRDRYSEVDTEAPDEVWLRAERPRTDWSMSPWAKDPCGSQDVSRRRFDRIDPVTLKVTDTIDIGTTPGSIAVGLGKVWVTAY